jgi:hypothetical protein
LAAEQLVQKYTLECPDKLPYVQAVLREMKLIK